MMHLMHIYFLL
uniref:Uncharacterized protein n=1 Tax=Rhizophora mucronata TaxID=61149 RepID=A0A2P2QCZ6_RHIMU